jgi:hypothetical protein
MNSTGGLCHKRTAESVFFDEKRSTPSFWRDSRQQPAGPSALIIMSLFSVFSGKLRLSLFVTFAMNTDFRGGINLMNNARDGAVTACPF